MIAAKSHSISSALRLAQIHRQVLSFLGFHTFIEIDFVEVLWLRNVHIIQTRDLFSESSAFVHFGP